MLKGMHALVRCVLSKKKGVSHVVQQEQTGTDVSGSHSGAGTSGFVAASTLEDTRDRGAVQCGVSDGLPGFSSPDDEGNWQGIDVDVCRAVAAAVFGDADAVRYISLNAVERFTALQSGEVDILSRNTTWTTTRDTTLGLNFAGTNFYDGQGFLINRDLGVGSASELDGAAVCVQSGTTTELNLADYFRANGMEFDPIVFDTSEQTVGGSKRAAVMY